MTRFKELRRIEAAIAHRDEGELRWALAYSQKRLRFATMKHHEKDWRRIEARVVRALEELSGPGDDRET